MTDFAIHPPVHLRTAPDTAIRSLDQAASIVRAFAGDHADTRAESVLHRIEGAVTPDQAEEAGDAFRQWAELRGLLLIPPEDRLLGQAH